MTKYDVSIGMGDERWIKRVEAHRFSQGEDNMIRFLDERGLLVWAIPAMMCTGITPVRQRTLVST